MWIVLQVIQGLHTRLGELHIPLLYFRLFISGLNKMLIISSQLKQLAVGIEFPFCNIFVLLLPSLLFHSRFYVQTLLYVVIWLIIAMENFLILTKFPGKKDQTIRRTLIFAYKTFFFNLLGLQTNEIFKKLANQHLSAPSLTRKNILGRETSVCR